MGLRGKVLLIVVSFAGMAGANVQGPLYIDVNGDGLYDRCARASDGIYCRLGTDNYTLGRPEKWTVRFGDDADWNQPYYGETVQFGDVNGDGLADVCGRGAKGIVCGLSNGYGFDDATLWEIDGQTKFGNDKGWAKSPKYYRSIELEDFNRDGKMDIEGRGPEGRVRLFSNGAKFVERR